jgi:hypothetical protein
MVLTNNVLLSRTATLRSSLGGLKAETGTLYRLYNMNNY